MWRLLETSGEIKFRCYEGNWGVIPEPYPAWKLLPDWYKKLPPKMKDDPDKKGPGGLKSSTIKRCAPFTDAMGAGWIIPLAGDIEFKVNEDASGVDYKWEFNGSLIENHSPAQIGGEEHPSYPKPPMKFINHWQIIVPKGYSVLFVPPLNRPNPYFECISGFVDCDKYEEFINFPFIWNKPNWEGVIPAGTPLVQAIPIKRSSLISKAVTEMMTVKQFDDLEKLRRRRNAHESLYRDYLWERKW